MKNYKSCCYGFVDFRSASCAELCLKEINGTVFMGRRIKLIREFAFGRLKLSNIDHSVITCADDLNKLFNIFGELELEETVFLPGNKF